MLKIIKGIDKPLFIISIILFALGLVTIYSASNVTAYMLNEADPSRYFVKELIFLVCGFLMALVIVHIPTKKYGILSWLATIIIGVVIFVLALLTSRLIVLDLPTFGIPITMVLVGRGSKPFIILFCIISFDRLMISEIIKFVSDLFERLVVITLQPVFIFKNFAQDLLNFSSDTSALFIKINLGLFGQSSAVFLYQLE